MVIHIIKCLLLCLPPWKIFIATSPGHLDEGPCNMRESQHEPVVEIGKAQEASKLKECGWGWLVTDDLDLGWIHMYTMLINNVAQVMDHVHAEGAFFQVGV